VPLYSPAGLSLASRDDGVRSVNDDAIDRVWNCGAELRTGSRKWFGSSDIPRIEKERLIQ